jgi:hypothetical protein
MHKFNQPYVVVNENERSFAVFNVLNPPATLYFSDPNVLFDSIQVPSVCVLFSGRLAIFHCHSIYSLFLHFNSGKKKIISCVFLKHQEPS